MDKLTIDEIEFELANNCCNFGEDPQKFIRTCVALSRQGMNDGTDEFSASLLDAVIKNIGTSVITEWTSGDSEKWVAYARKMKSAILNNVTILESIKNKWSGSIGKKG